MKKIISFVLAAVLLVSAVPTALATNDYSQGTQVVYEATGNESYTITVPAKLAPGGSGTVTLSGTWADNRIVTVTADPTVTLTNSIKAEDQKVLNVHFDGISEAGSNIGSQTFTESVSVDDITNALFGTWSGKFNYNVEVSNTSNTGTKSGSYIFIDDASTTQHDMTVNLSSDTITDFSSVKVKCVGQNLLDADSLVKSNASLSTGGFYSNGDGTYTMSRVGNSRFSNFVDVYIPAGSIIRLDATLVEESEPGVASLLRVGFRGADPNTQAVHLGFTSLSGNPTDYAVPFDVVEIYIWQSEGAANGSYATLKDLQIAINVDRIPEYTPYTEQIVVADADGTVTGLKSISPTMLIYTDSDDVQIKCEYNSVKKN